MDGTENHSLNDLLPYRTNRIGDAAARHGHKSSLARFEPLLATPRRLKSQRITLAAAWNNRKPDAWGGIWFRLRPNAPSSVSGLGDFHGQLGTFDAGFHAHAVGRGVVSHQVLEL